MLIRYYGNIGGQSGYAEAAREFCMSMLAAGLNFEISASPGELTDRYLPLASRVRDRSELTPNPDVAIVHTMPLDCRTVVQVDDLGSVPRRIAYTTWEGCGPVSPVICHALAEFHEVWVPCQTNMVDFQHGFHPEALDPQVIAVVPHAYDADLEVPAPDRGSVYRFYYVGVWNQRKNVEGLIRAYLRAFTAQDEVQLLIQSAGAMRTATAVAALAATGQSDGLPSIAFSCGWLSEQQLREVHALSHCYVTATRGEAWNLPAFHAMLAGNHVIAPAQMGHDDFLRETSATLYGSTPVPAHGEIQIIAPAGDGSYHGKYLGAQGLTCRNDWLEPDLIELADHMREAYRTRRAGITLRYDPAERYSRQAVGRRIRGLLENR